FDCQQHDFASLTGGHEIRLFCEPRMGPLVTLDAAVFRFINLTLSNPVFDWLMPFFSSNAFFFPVALTLVGLVAWKGGTRARMCVVLLILTVVLGDNWVCNTIKKAVAR